MTFSSEQHEENNRLQTALRASIGHMMNARIDFATGKTKATTIRTLEAGISAATAALKHPTAGRRELNGVAL